MATANSVSFRYDQREALSPRAVIGNENQKQRQTPKLKVDVYRNDGFPKST